jgi:hypothetical protein
MKHKYDHEVVWLQKTELPFLTLPELLMPIIEEKYNFSKFIQCFFVENGDASRN